MPRPYRLGKRAVAREETRRRILEAAAALYAELGIRATSLQRVARRAGVSPATVLNHFADADALAEAVVAVLLESLRVPTAAVLEGHRTRAARVRALARELARFYARSRPLYAMYESERDAVPALHRTAEKFYANLERILRVALGPLGRDDRVVATVDALLAPSTLGHLEARGMSVEEAAEAAADVATAWLAREGKRRQRRQRSS